MDTVNGIDFLESKCKVIIDDVFEFQDNGLKGFEVHFRFYTSDVERVIELIPASKTDEPKSVTEEAEFISDGLAKAIKTLKQTQMN
jgi:hypothetical protein